MRSALRVCAVVVLLFSSQVLAGKMEELVADTPPGSYWDETCECFVLKEPIPLDRPVPSGSIQDQDTILFDGDTMAYFVMAPGPGYFVLTKMPAPPCSLGDWILMSVLLGCYNTIDSTPDSGSVVIYEYHSSEGCTTANPEGDSLGDSLGGQRFLGLPYDPWDPDSHPRAQWTQVELDVPITITDSLFWVAWDYRPVAWGNSFYVTGNYRSTPPVPADDSVRYFEWFGTDCVTRVSSSLGPWLIRAIGHCEGVGVAEEGQLRSRSPVVSEIRCYPSPARNNAVFEYDLHQPADVSIDVFDMSGRQIVTIARGTLDPGHHSVSWDCVDSSRIRIASGIYFLHLQACPEGSPEPSQGQSRRTGGFTETRKMVVVR